MKTLHFFIHMLFACLTFAIISSCTNDDIINNMTEDNNEIKSDSTIESRSTKYLLYQVYPYVVVENGYGTAYVKVYTNNYHPTGANLVFTINLTMKDGSLGPSRNVGVTIRQGECEGYGSYSCGPDIGSEITATLDYMIPETVEGYTTVVEFPRNK